MNGSFREPFDVELTNIPERPEQLNLTSVDEVGDLSHYLPVIISYLADCPHQAKQGGVEAGSNLWRLIELRFHCCQRLRRVYSFFSTPSRQFSGFHASLPEVQPSFAVSCPGAVPTSLRSSFPSPAAGQE